MTYEIYDDLITLRLVQEACEMLGENHFILKIFNFNLFLDVYFCVYLHLCLCLFALVR